MTDDRLDHELTESLRAYESRLPDAPPPPTGASRSTAVPRWPILGVGALAAVAAVLLLAVLIRGFANENIGDASPSPVPSVTGAPSEPAPGGSSEPLESDGSSPTPTPQPTASPPDPTVELEWTETASFGSSEAPTTVTDLVRSDFGLIAVGVAYDGPLPILGPTPRHEGRVWISSDAVNWADITPESTFQDAEIRHLLVSADGSLIAHGWVDTDDLGRRRVAAWQSTAGRDWEEIDTGFPEEAWPMSMAQGAQGLVAIVVDPEGPMLAVWWSAEGRDWQRVHELEAEGGYSIGAGEEGFVVAGYRGTEQEPHTIASGDGRSWFEAGTPPGVSAGVVSRGGDWLAVSREVAFGIGEPSTAHVWSSGDGLTWGQAGAFELRSREAGGAPCTEWPTSLHAAGPWLIAGTIVSYPCSEGGVQTQGRQLISLDGGDWSELPFAPASEEVGLGTRISGAVEVDNRLILVGEQDRVATFWIGEHP
jgi:hypothetical protein